MDRADSTENLSQLYRQECEELTLLRNENIYIRQELMRLAQESESRLSKATRIYIEDYGYWRTEATKYKKRAASMRLALEKIANPIAWLETEAWSNGMAVDGDMAAKLADTPDWYREAATKALAQIEPIKQVNRIDKLQEALKAVVWRWWAAEGGFPEPPFKQVRPTAEILAMATAALQEP